jgi:hypothetical protein
MRGRLALIFFSAVGLAAAYVAARLAANDSAEGIHLVNTLFPAGATAMGIVGCFAAAAQFERGDFLRRGWIVQGAGYVSLTASALWRGFAPASTVVPARIVFTLFSNTAEIWGAILFARVWLVAGIELPGSRLGRRGVVILAIVVALLIAGLPTALGVRDVIRGKYSGAVSVFSSLGDMVALVLIAPILLTALALRGEHLPTTIKYTTQTKLYWQIYV